MQAFVADFSELAARFNQRQNGKLRTGKTRFNPARAFAFSPDVTLSLPIAKTSCNIQERNIFYFSLLCDKLKNSLNKNSPIIARSALQVEGNSAANILNIASTNFRKAHKTEKEFSNLAIACDECCSVCSTR